jgi:large subunit ribosomal protein L30
MSQAVAVVRVRGRTHIRGQIEDTLKMLNLTRKNHCTIIPDTGECKGMVAKAKDYVTWGQVDEKAILKLLKERGMVIGDKRLTDEYVKDNSGYSDIKALSLALEKGEARLRDVKGLKPVFRLKPPVKGFERKGIKKPYSVGGALGDRGDKIKELIVRMI